MKKAGLLLIWLALAITGHAQVFPVETILNNGVAAKRIKFVFLSDGYQANELPTYLTQVHAVQEVLFSQTPFKEYKNFFNVYALSVPSVESGADHPGTASDEGSGSQPITTVNTYFNSTFDYADIHRLVVPQNFSAVYNVLIDNLPDYDQGFVLVNSPYYGGSGGSFSAATTDASSAEVAIHEIGHSFAGLADEYAIGGQGERPNRTTVTDPATVKWKSWLGTNDIGIFPIGVEGWQRPHQDCKMQFLGAPFCSICSEAFITRIYSLLTPIYSVLPAASPVQVGTATTFSAVLTLPEPNTLHTEWKLNGSTIATGVDSVVVQPAMLIAGVNNLSLYVVDQTTLSRTYWPNAGYVFSQSWQINSAMSPVQSIEQPNKFYYQMSPNPTPDQLMIQGKMEQPQEIVVEMYSATGTQVYRQTIAAGNSFQHTVAMSGFAAGMYTVVLRLPNGYMVQEQIVKAP